ncbi:hypothetical protein DIC82_15020 [Clostridium beijerinckii]|nr:hypothetical protein DIC82_15020 [Clostridium beijerinckii]
MKPILFNTAMVQALLDSKKTTTRRNIKRTPSNDEPSGYGFWKEFNNSDGRWYIKDYTHAPVWWTLEEYISKYSKYHVGDVLYVRETWQEWTGGYAYKVGGDYPQSFIDKWKPSIHMPKEAARIFLKVTDIRIERLHDMEHKDFLSEGIREYTKDNQVFKYAASEDQFSWRDMPRTPRKAFENLWDSTVNKSEIDMYGWNANPYVWVIEFEKNREE